MIRTISLIAAVSFCCQLACGEESLQSEQRSEYDLLLKMVKHHGTDACNRDYERMLRAQAYRQEALILDTDRDPADVVLRRTAALLKHLQSNADSQQLQKLGAMLGQLKEKSEGMPVSDVSARRRLHIELCSLRRKIAFANPLLDFEKIIFLKHHRARYNHMVDQYFGINAVPGGSVFVLTDPFGDSPVAKDLLANVPVENGRLAGRVLRGGSFVSLELDFDGESIAFAWTEGQRQFKNDKIKGLSEWSPQSAYHVFRAAADGSGLRQLTNGRWNEFDPCFLPSGRIAFISERRGGHIRCSQRPDPTYTLFEMNGDGSGIAALSYHETSEWHPSVNNEGMIIYSRWDYVDRAPNMAHHLWITYPDGRDPRSLHGNYPIYLADRTFAEMSMRAIPETHEYLAVSTPHHGQAYGSLILIDDRIEDDNRMSQVRRITPEVPLPEADVATRRYKKTTPRPSLNLFGSAEAYGTPWPLSKDFYLAVFDAKCRNYGIYLLDSFGNRELLYRDPAIACLDPIPLRARKKPTTIPTMTERPTSEQNMGTVAIVNIYESDFRWPKGAKIKSLRVIQLFPRLNYKQWEPNIGAARQSLARGVLGTAPVEEDGSVYFKAPACKPIYFQALDQDGLAVQSMRSATYLHPGERLVCLGCHEKKRRGPKLSNNVPMAFKRAASDLTPEVDGAYPVLFPRLVQPVLDRKCVTCHEKEEKAPDLTARISDRSFPDHLDIESNKPGLSWGWSEAMVSLAPLGNYQGGRSWLITEPYHKGGGSRSIAGEVGAKGSKLYALLKAAHYDTKLTKEELHRITLWLDTNCLFFGAYRDIEKQQQGHVVMPILQ